MVIDLCAWSRVYACHQAYLRMACTQWYVRLPNYVLYTYEKDAVGSVQFHPLDPNCLVSVGGARHWDDHDDIASGPAPYEQDAKIWHLDMIN